MPLGSTNYSDFNVQLGSEYEYYLKAFYDNPIGFSLPSNTASITYYNPGQPLWGDNFEDYSDFAINLPNWTVYDLDANPTYSLDNYDFDHEGSPMSFIVFNPSATSPPMEGLLPYGGDKFLASFAPLEGQNNDWIISPIVIQGPISTVSFFAKSYSPESGLERFKVKLSLGGNNIEDFVYSLHPYIEYLEAPSEWTLFSFNTSTLVNHPLRYAIQCVSTDGTIFMVDDFRIDSLEGTENNDTVDEIPHINILSQNYPNPFNPETSIAFTTKEAGNVTIDIYNLKGQKIKTLLNERRNAGQHSLVWNGKDDNNKEVATGLYFYRMKCGTFSSTKKMILMK